MEAIFYTLIALMGIKQHKLSTYRSKYVSDTDLLGLAKDHAESGQEQLTKIKNIKKNISMDLLKHYLPGKDTWVT